MTDMSHKFDGAVRKLVELKRAFNMRGANATTMNRVIALLADLANQREWQPIETAPKDGTPILAADSGPFAYVVEWFAAGRTWLGADGMYWEPTHWMPLPEPPKQGDDQ